MTKRFSTQDKKNTFWNGLATILQACQSLITVMLVTRVEGVETAGIVTLAFSLANLFLTLGKFGMKNFQIAHEGTDVRFITFRNSRIITTSAMLTTVLVYLAVRTLSGGYDLQKSGIILGICIWYIIDAIDDVYLGGFQSRGMLEYGSRIYIIRWVGILASFLLCEYFSGNIFLSISIAIVIAIVIEIFALRYFVKKCPAPQCESVIDVKKLLIINIPLCLSAFAYYYMTNIPRYAIDIMIDDRVQAIYGYIAMPVFIISSLNNILFQPQLTHYLEDLRQGKTEHLKKRIIRQLFIILIMLVVLFIAAIFIGIPVLSLLFGVELSAFRMHMLVILAGSAFLATGEFISTVLILMDKLKHSMWIYIGASAAGSFIVFILTENYLMTGAVYGFLITMVISAVAFLIVLHYDLKALKK